MYIPHKYKNGNLAEVKDFLTKNSFGILVNQVDGKPWATHIPMELETTDDGQDVLVSHIAKANPQWKHFTENDNVLCIFNGSCLRKNQDFNRRRSNGIHAQIG